MASISSSIFPALSTGWFWEDAEYACLALLVLAAVIAAIAELTWVAEIDELRRHWTRVAAFVLILASVGELLATYKANTISDKTTEDLKHKTALAYQLAGELGVKEGQLKSFVDTKTEEIDTSIDALNKAQKRAKESLAKIDPLAARQVALSREITTDENRLIADEQKLSDDEQDLRDFADAILPRPLMGYLGANTTSPLRKYADVPIFLSASPDPESLGIQNGIASIMESDTGKRPTVLPPDSHLFNGVRVTAADPVLGLSGNPMDEMKLHESIEHTFEAAELVCRELSHLHLPEVSTDQDFVEPDSKTFKPPWIVTVPLNGIIIRVGPKSQGFLERRMSEQMGQAWVNEQKKKMNEHTAWLTKRLGVTIDGCHRPN